MAIKIHAESEGQRTSSSIFRLYDKETYLSFAGMELQSGNEQREDLQIMGAIPNYALQSAIDEYVDRMAAKLPELEERPLLEVGREER